MLAVSPEGGERIQDNPFGSRYRIVEEIGAGGMGVVVAAEDLTLGRTVAIKYAAPGAAAPAQRERLLREARAASRLEHPNIARVYDCAETSDGRPYIVMELVRGESLDQVIRRGPLEPARAREIFTGILAGLGEAHDAGLLHRDIKPSNIMLNGRGEVKVLDFGLAKPAAAALDETQAEVTAPGALIGTPAYMSPEQVRGEPLDARSDLFSAALVFYACLTGRPAFAARNPAELLAQVLYTTPPPPSSVRAELGGAWDAFFARALAPRREDRFESAVAMHAAIEAPAAAPRRVFHFNRRRAAVAVVLAAAALTVWQPWRRPLELKPEATRWYREGVDALRDGTYLTASRALERASQIDPRFPPINARLAEAWSELDYLDKARETMLRIDASLEARLSATERLEVEAVRALLTRDFPTAIARYQRLLTLVPTEGRAQVMVDLGRAQEKSEQVEPALASYREAARLDPQYAAAFLRLGVLEGRAKTLEIAEPNLRTAETLYQASSNAEGLCEVEARRGALFNMKQRLPEAKASLERALVLARAAGSEYREVTLLLDLSSVMVRTNDLPAGERLAQDALDRARAAGLTELTVRGLTDLGLALFIKGAYSDAEARFRQAAQIAGRNGMAGVEARATFMLASVLMQQGRNSAALPFLESARTFYTAGSYATQSGQVLVLLARSARQAGKFDAALEATAQLRRLAKERGDRQQEATAGYEEARILDAREQPAAALPLLEPWMALARETKNQLNLGYGLTARAAILAKLGDLPAARAALDEAAQIANSPGGPKVLLRGLVVGRAETATLAAQWAQVEASLLPLLGLRDLGAGLRTHSLLMLARATLRQSRLAEAESRLGEAAALAAQLDDPAINAQLGLLRAEVHLAAGRGPQALEQATASAAAFQALVLSDSAWRAHATAAAAARAVNNPALAAREAAAAQSLIERASEQRGGTAAKNCLDLPLNRIYLQMIAGVPRPS